MGCRLALHIPPITLHAELHTVLHHGKTANLALARFTQQKGARSSFLRIVNALEKIMKEKGLLIVDKVQVEEIRKWTHM